MDLEYFLLEKRTAILERWLNLICDTYSSQSSKFLRQDKDRFTNPIGYTTSQEIETLYMELIQGMNVDKLSASLNNIIKIRAVQNFSPSQAISFVFLLKQVIREELENETRQNQLFKELLQFESGIDTLSLLGLDLYTKCREKIHELRVNEVRAERERAFKLLERTGSMHGKLAEEHGLKDE